MRYETSDTEKSTETENLTASTSGRMSNHEVDISSSASVTSKEVVNQIRAIPDPVTKQLAQLCEETLELKNEQAGRRNEEASSFRATSWLSGSINRSDIYFS